MHIGLSRCKSLGSTTCITKRKYIEISDQQERIPTGEWSKFIVFFMAVSRFHKPNFTLQPHSLDCLEICVQHDSLSTKPYELNRTKDRAHSKLAFWVDILFYGCCTHRWQKASPDKHCFAFWNDVGVINGH